MEAVGNEHRISRKAISAAALSAGRLEQDGTPMEIQELFLAAGKPSHIDNFHGVDPHPLERRAVGDRGDYKPSVVFEANEPAIEEMIDARCKKQSVFAVEPLFIGRVPPRLAVTGYQVHGIFDAGDAAPGFDPAHSLLKQTLSTPGADNACRSVSRTE